MLRTAENNCNVRLLIFIHKAWGAHKTPKGFFYLNRNRIVFVFVKNTAGCDTDLMGDLQDKWCLQTKQGSKNKIKNLRFTNVSNLQQCSEHACVYM